MNNYLYICINLRYDGVYDDHSSCTVAETTVENLTGHDVVFLALPHGASADVAARLPEAIDNLTKGTAGGLYQQPLIVTEEELESFVEALPGIVEGAHTA